MSDPKESLTAQVAAAIRAAVPDEEQCLADEDECFRKHPIHLKASRDGVVEMVFADVEGASKVVAEALERSDLPVGHSNESFTNDKLASVEARVRAQVAEDLARVIERRAAEYDGSPRFVLNDLAEDLRRGCLAPAESVVAALPDTDPESDVAIAEQMLPAGADVFGMVPLSSGCRRGECALCDFGSIHAPCAHDCHVPESALPDVVDTPDHQEG